MTKKITAPKTYNPGKGRPVEHLAYLNEREMAYLRSINGNNKERGPRGLPSFPPDDALGSSSGTTTGTTTSGGGGLGAGGQRGAGSNYGGGSGQPGTTSSTPASSVTSPSSSQTSGQRGAGSNYGPGSGRPTVSGSIGGSLKDQSRAFSQDSIAQQAAQIGDALSAVRGSPALRGDVQVAGIRSINVGPMQMSVPVSAKTSLPSNIPGMIPASPTVSRVNGYRSYDSPLQPGMTPEDMALRGAMMEKIRQSMIDDNLLNYGRVTPTGNPNMAGGVPPTITSVRDLGLGSFPASAPPIDPLAEPTVPPPIDFTPYGPQPPERVLQIEDVPPEPVTPQIGRRQQAAINALREARFQSPTAPSFDSVYNPNDEFSEATSIPSWKQGPTVGPSPMAPSVDETVPVDENGNVIGPETPNNDYPDESLTENPVYGEPGDIQRPKGPLDKWGPKLPGILGLMFKGQQWAQNKSWESMSPDERMAQMDKWKQMNHDYLTRYGTDNDKRMIDRSSNPKVVPPAGGRSPGTKDTTRPAIYFQWDAGINIPSPSDSTYTLYQQYLAEKEAAQ